MRDIDQARFERVLETFKRLDPELQDAVANWMDRSLELEDQGMDRDDAARQAARESGNARLIAGMEALLAR